MFLCRIFDRHYAYVENSITKYSILIGMIGLSIFFIGVDKCMASATDSTLIATIRFRQGSSKLETSFSTNTGNLLLADSALSSKLVSRVIIVGSASPEGLEELNMQLSKQRAFAVADYLKKKMLTGDSVEIVTIGENWSLLRKLVFNDTSFPYRNMILEIIDSNRDETAKQRLISALDRGNVLRKLMSTLYPELRQASIYADISSAVSIQNKMREVLVVDTVNQITPASEMPPPIKISETVAEPLAYDCNKGLDKRFAIKTNTLYWLALTPNLEAELFVASQWSVNAEYQYGWWANNSKHNYWRVASGGAEIRYWLSSDRGYFNGHFVGAYLSGGIYEFMFRPELGLQGEVYASGGLTYGYTLPLGCNFAIEFSVGVGYLNTLYRKYHWNGECYQYDKSQQLHYLGPTKAKVSLMWRIGKGKKKR